MTNADKIAYVKALVEDDPAATDALVTVYLSEAQADILLRLYRVYNEVPAAATVPTIYDFTQCKLAARKFLRRGGQGEISHNENGVNRTYHSTDDEELLKDILPYARVM